MFVYDQTNGDNWSGYFGSKPDLKYHIRRVFNQYRAVESLFFAVKAEFERIKTITFNEGEIDQSAKNDF